MGKKKNLIFSFERTSNQLMCQLLRLIYQIHSTTYSLIFQSPPPFNLIIPSCMYRANRSCLIDINSIMEQLHVKTPLS